MMFLSNQKNVFDVLQRSVSQDTTQLTVLRRARDVRWETSPKTKSRLSVKSAQKTTLPPTLAPLPSSNASQRVGTLIPNDPPSFLTSNNSIACVVVQPNSPCLSSPCGDNGLCVYTSSGGFECICANDYTGNRCDVSPDPCDVNGCLNGGTCQAREDAFNYTCACDDGWTGFFCEHRIGNTLLPPLSAPSPFHLFYGCSKTVLNSYFYQWNWIVVI